MDGAKYPKPAISIYIFTLITTVKFAVSQFPGNDCILNFGNLSSYTSSCEGGEWGGFLNNNCCGGLFDEYLYALGQRANQTGLIYLNSSEQMNCLNRMNSVSSDVQDCGIEKLTRGSGGCSEFSVEDVNGKLGDKLRTLKEGCKLESPAREWNQSCGSCVRSWEDIRGTYSYNGESTEVESDICRFAVLVSLTSSRIADNIWVQKILKCLGEQDSGIGLWILIGGAIGIAMAAIILIWILSRRWHKSNVRPQKDATKNAILKGSGYLKVPIKEVYSATNNLNESNFIGEGMAGKVYKGTLSNNQHVAVKHITSDGNVETFLREVRSLSHVKHPNLVALLGYCENEDECFLIYELCPNGNLAEWLFGKHKVLSWIQRLHIAVDSARGLWFLHTYPEGCIVHRDIKPTNILLGTNFEAKLSDFGLSKVIDLGQTQVSSEVRGTFGYVDPEYQCNHQVNSSGDVYSFGIVLLQILSGRKVINMNLKKPMPLSKMAKSLTRGRSIAEFADPKLDGGYSSEAFDLTFKLALSCTTLREQRPSMEQVVIKLEEALDISTRAETSTPPTTPDLPSTP
ncbi:hypothetical protein F0562_004661 [Nyssa sinensis]|uniref:Protein kinase domain-containing protein n=1 Tax=Nyssa sinensis TaxID=561372 RepID=A0A5J5BYQ8_9ASTE|nr:hypothetical protein F0562_004661 [Nyssa sinensis]